MENQPNVRVINGNKLMTVPLKMALSKDFKSKGWRIDDPRVKDGKFIGEVKEAKKETSVNSEKAEIELNEKLNALEEHNEELSQPAKIKAEEQNHIVEPNAKVEKPAKKTRAKRKSNK